MDCLTLGQYMQPTKRHLKVNTPTAVLLATDTFTLTLCVSLGFRWRNMSLQRGLPTGKKLAVIWASPTQPADHWCDPPTKQVRSDVNKCLLVFFGYINIQHVQPVCKEY